MKRETGSAAAVIVILILLLAAGAFYFLYYKDQPAEQDNGTTGQEEVETGDETAADDGDKPKAHERIRDNYKKKLQKRVVNIPE